MLNANQDIPLLEDFEDFAIKYPFEEVCCMLVQIVSDARSGFYLNSAKIGKAIIASHKTRVREQAIQS